MEAGAGGLRPVKKRQGIARGPGALDLLEEAVHLLRNSPPAVLAIHLLSAAPFVLALLFFWANATWFAPDAATIAWQVAGLSMLFVAMKTGQAAFVARLREVFTGTPDAPWTAGRMLSVAGHQLRLQPAGLFILPVAAIAAIPFGWLYAYYQNLTVSPAAIEGRSQASAAWAEALRWPRQNHAGILILSGFALFVWANIAAALAFVPMLLNRLLGIETPFAFTGWIFLNTTFLAVVTGIAWLAVDPLVKAFYLLRCHYGAGTQSGEDLLLDLAAWRRRRRSGAVAGIAAALVLGLVQPTPACATPRANPQPVTAGQVPVEPGALGQSVREVLAGRDFQWRLRPLPKPPGPVKSWIIRVAEEGGRIVREMFRGLARLLQRLTQWIAGLIPERVKKAEPGAGSTSRFRSVMEVVAIVLIAVLVVLLVIVGVTLFRKRPRAVTAVAAAGGAPSPPDLEDESLQASQLPEAGWLALAREKIAAGEWRLALRALYLARLARLSHEGLIRLARHKTNRDYEEEVRRRCRARRDLPEAFRRHRVQFEDVWYGDRPAAPAMVHDWISELGPAAAS